MRVLADGEIEAYTVEIIQNAKQYEYYELAAILIVLKETGCRIMEVLDSSRWSIAANGDLLLVTEKTQFVRRFDANLLGPMFYNSVADKSLWYFNLSYSALRLQYYSCIPYKVFYQKKEVLFHAFRHNYTKTKKRAGFTEIEIANDLGIRLNTAIYSYINSSLNVTN